MIAAVDAARPPMLSVSAAFQDAGIRRGRVPSVLPSIQCPLQT